MKTNNGYLPAMPIQITQTLVDAMDNGAMKAVERISGMTKREVFAMSAMTGLLASDTCGNLAVNRCAELSVQHADALLAELEK